jgi:thioester reductase-like protein
VPRPGFDSVLLITGFPSFYARKLLEEVLAREPGTFVYALTYERTQPVGDRPHTMDAAAALAALPDDQRARVAMIEGDVASIDLGLSGAEIESIRQEVDVIQHMAHTAFVGADPRVAARVNVTGAAEIVAFARECPKLRCLVFHSTAHVSGDRAGVVFEDELDVGQRFRTVVEETRMRGEKIARRAMHELPIAVVRPTMTVGDSGTGEFDRMNGLYLLAMLLVTMPPDVALPFPGKGDSPMNIVPIDYVVRAALAIGNHPSAPGRTFHIADPSPLPALAVFDRLAQAGGRRASKGHIPSGVAKAIFRTPGVDRLLQSPRAFMEQLTMAVRYDTRNADPILAAANIVCPPFETYVEQLVSVVQEHVRSRREKRDEPRGTTAAEVDDPLH